jgi:hypothetical protein
MPPPIAPLAPVINAVFAVSSNMFNLAKRWR